MTTNDANAAFALAFYDAFTAGDRARLRPLIAEAARWHVGGNNSLTGTYTGPDAIFGLFDRIGEISAGSFSLTLHDVLVSDHHVVGLAIVRGRRGGEAVDERIVHILHVEGGQLAEFWGFPESTAGFDDFWS